jgi:hypothetical protein
MDSTVDIAPPSPLSRLPTKPGRDPQKSRVTNGKVLIAGIDQRSPWVRRCKDILASHLSDLGGMDNTSAAERSIIRRVAVLTTELERMEKTFALAGEASPEELDIYARGAGHMRRLLEAVGIQRRPKVIGPTLGEILLADEQQQRESS